jgi:transketolase
MTGNAIRRIVIEQSKRAGVGHIGSALSVADIVGVLFGGVLRDRDAAGTDRDRFVLSKGHAVLAVYAALALRGTLPTADLDTYCADGTLLGVHPDRTLPGIDFSTGSLGFGLPVGVGAALAARLQGADRRVFVLVSDAECNEGSVWEAVMFAAHHRLGRLTVIVDQNGQQALGKTDDVLSLAPLAPRWAAFGWRTVEIDGHDTTALGAALGAPQEPVGAPRVIVARTVFGKGVSYMEGELKWHYWPMSDTEYRQAMAELS